MNSEFQEQARRLQELRRSVALRSVQGATGNSVGDPGGSDGQDVMLSGGGVRGEPVQDPLIYPGLYSPSGFDMMGILVRIRTRPNPTIDIGNIDSGVSLVLCDTAIADMPIIYCSEPFEHLTGYSSAEILGRNCRFLQTPPLGRCADENVRTTNELSRKELREKFAEGEEARVRFVNFRKDGKMFVNVLTTIPISWDEGDGEGKRYIVGFQADEGHVLRG